MREERLHNEGSCWGIQGRQEQREEEGDSHEENRAHHEGMVGQDSGHHEDRDRESSHEATEGRGVHRDTVEVTDDAHPHQVGTALHEPHCCGLCRAVLASAPDEQCACLPPECLQVGLKFGLGVVNDRGLNVAWHGMASHTIQEFDCNCIHCFLIALILQG